MKSLQNLLIVLSSVFICSMSANALKTDQNQPATLDADEFDLDFQTGVRTYRGNVVYQQGSIRLYADEIVAYFKNDQLERVIARGNPAEFYQLPDDSETEVVGVALRIEMDDKQQIVTLQDRAKVTQDANTITGKKITYNMATEKVNVRSGPRKKQKPRIKHAADEAVATNKDAAAKESEAEALSGGDEAEESATNRPRLVIQPRN